ncbi:MAG: LPS assembly protein LptD [Desulfobacteraceae bacterium]|nr:LPS assembly protein LptD [Desulfobacteraceae bacterium]
MMRLYLFRSIFILAIFAVLFAVNTAAADDKDISTKAPHKTGESAAASASPGEAAAPPEKTEPWHIEADSLTFYQSTNVILGDGAVKIQRGDLKISADRVLYDTKHDKVWASGAVVINLGQDTMSGEEGEFNLKTSTGSMKGAHLFLQRNNVHLVAKQLWKTGTEEYRAKDAVISTCPLPKQAWSFRCGDLKLTMTGQAVATDARFNIRNIPVLYSPWVSIPINRYRKSGLLLPYFSTSNRNGTEFDIPYFLVINDSMDATFYQDPMSNRGWMEGVEFRHIFSPESKGIIRYNYMVDTLKDNDYNNDGQVRGNTLRWWLRTKIDQELPLGFKAKLDVDYASDRDYIQEFDEGPMGYNQTNRQFLKVFGRSLAEETDPIRPSTLQITRNGTDSFMGSEFRYNNNLIIGQQDTTVQTLPKFIFHGFSVPLLNTPFYYNWDASYVNYWRNSGTKEQRVYLDPSLSLPFKLKNWTDGLLTGTAEETMYTAGGQTLGTGVDSKANRLLYTLSADTTTTFMKVFDLGNGSALSHTIRPKLAYTYRPTVDQNNLPFIDSIDRLNPLNRVTWSVLSFLSSKKSLGGNRYAFTDLIRLYLEQSYDSHGIPEGPPMVQNYISYFDFFNTNTPNPAVINPPNHKFSDMYGEIEYRPVPYWYLRYDTTYNTYGDGFTSYNLWSGLQNNRGDNVNLSYRYNKIENINSLNINMLVGFTQAWSGTYKTAWSVENGGEVESVYGLRYKSSCWAVTCNYKKSGPIDAFGCNLELLGIGGWGGE